MSHRGIFNKTNLSLHPQYGPSFAHEDCHHKPTCAQPRLCHLASCHFPICSSRPSLGFLSLLYLPLSVTRLPHLPFFILLSPLLRDNAVEILRPRRPAKHTLRVIMTGLITQHGAFAGGVGARGMPWVLAAVITWRFRAVWRVDAASRCSGSPSNSPIIPSRAKGRSWSCSSNS